MHELAGKKMRSTPSSAQFIRHKPKRYMVNGCSPTHPTPNNLQPSHPLCIGRSCRNVHSRPVESSQACLSYAYSLALIKPPHTLHRKRVRVPGLIKHLQLSYKPFIQPTSPELVSTKRTLTKLRRARVYAYSTIALLSFTLSTASSTFNPSLRMRYATTAVALLLTPIPQCTNTARPVPSCSSMNLMHSGR